MTLIRMCFLLSTVVILAAACAAGRGDILFSDTSEFDALLSHVTGRANVKVSQDNKLEISQNLITAAFSTFEEALQSLAASPDTGSARIVRMPGKFYGYAEVSGNASMYENNRGMSFNVDLNYYAFSDSGAVFLGGLLNCLGAMTVRGNSLIADSLVFVGEIDFAGDFQGSVVFDSLFVPLEPEGYPVSTLYPTYCEMGMRPIIGNLIFQSGGNTIRFNPWYRVPIPCY